MCSLPKTAAHVAVDLQCKAVIQYNTECVQTLIIILIPSQYNL